MIRRGEDFHPCDFKQGINKANVGDLAYDLLETHGFLPIVKTFLGLAAGEGRAELELAKKVDAEEITLVDKNPPKIPGFDGTYQRADVFDFLEREQGKYDLVCAFGMEYRLKNPESAKRLWSGLEKSTHDGSAVIIQPCPDNFDLSQSSKFKKVMIGSSILLAKRT